MTTLDTHSQRTTIGIPPSSWLRRHLPVLVAVLVVAAIAATMLVIRSGGDDRVGATSGAVPVGLVADDQAHVRALADDHGLTGLSPASMVQVAPAAAPARDAAAIVELAEQNGLAGLSPASLAPVGD